MQIIEKILNEAALLTEGKKVEIKPIRPGNHERNPNEFLQALGITKFEEGRGIIRFYNYLEAADKNFLASIIKAVDFRQREQSKGLILIQFHEEFINAQLNELVGPIEKVSHTLGAFLFALKERRFIDQDFDIEAEQLDVDRYKITTKGKEDEIN